MKKAIEIVNKFEMIPPSGATGATGGGNNKEGMRIGGAAKGMIGGGVAGGYSSGNEGNSNAGQGIEIDPFTGIPYYDPSKSRSAKSVTGGGGGPKSIGGVIPPHRRLPGGASSLGEKGGDN